MATSSTKLICIQEYVIINGIRQHLYHRGSDFDNPVMLFLHGGPGTPESLFAHKFQEEWEEIFTIVHWDQRGCGKTLIKNKNKDNHPTIDLLLNDLLEITKYLKKKYNKEKIVLFGHSWGTVLGSEFIRKYPNEIKYYIGVGQVINIIENERVGYEKLKEVITKSDNKKDLKKLESLGVYPGETFDISLFPKIRKIRLLQGKYGLAIKMNFSMFFNILKSPIFKVSDFYAMLKANKLNDKLFDFLNEFNLNLESTEYDIPVHYILGENDWQTPYVIAQNYFEKIKSPYKKLYIIPSAGHMAMVDQPELFFNALLKIDHFMGSIS